MFIVDAEFAEAVGRYSWSSNADGYLNARIGGKTVVLHRFVWSLRHGDCPPVLDHINCVKWDCRLGNLRAATASLNNRNRTMPRKKHDLPRGVSRAESKTSPFQASIRINRRKEHLGVFPTPELASAAYEEARARAISHEERNHP